MIYIYAELYDLHTIFIPDYQFQKGIYRAMLCIRGTSHGPVSVRPYVCPSVRHKPVFY